MNIYCCSLSHLLLVLYIMDREQRISLLSAASLSVHEDCYHVSKLVISYLIKQPQFFLTPYVLCLDCYYFLDILCPEMDPIFQVRPNPCLIEQGDYFPHLHLFLIINPTMTGCLFLRSRTLFTHVQFVIHCNP